MQSPTFPLRRIIFVFCIFLVISSFYKIPKDQEAQMTTSVKISNDIDLKLTAEERQDFLHKRQQVETAVNTYFKNAVRKGLIVGAGVSIVKGDSVLLATGFGKRNARTKESIDAKTVFRLGSLSKGFAGVLAGKFEHDGLLDWNDKICEFIPNLQFKEKQHIEKVTLSHILSHTSGAPYHSYTDLIEHGVDLKKIAPAFRSVQPVGLPGEVYSYQNALFAMAGEATKSITGNPIDMDLKKYFFSPLNMESVSTDHRSLMATENKAFPHRKYRRGWKPIKLNDHYYNAVAAGGINASATDMAQWMHLLLGHKEDIVSPETLKEVFEPQIKIPGRSKYYQRWKGHEASYYAHGWRIHEFNDIQEITRTMIHHGGSVNNFRNEIAIFPEEDLGICILMNSMTSLASHVIPDLRTIITEIYQEESPTEAILVAN